VSNKNKGGLKAPTKINIMSTFSITFKNEFLYDTLMANIKETYKDSFGRKMKVKVLS